MSQTEMSTDPLGTQWRSGPVQAVLLPHPQDLQRALLQVSLPELGFDLSELEPHRLAHALRWMLRLNADVLLEQGSIMALGEDDELLLLQEVRLQDVRTSDQLHAMAQAGLDRGLEMAEVWTHLLLADAA